MHEESGRNRNPPEIPRVEPEIIPPGLDEAGSGGRERVWVSVDRGGGTRRVSVSAPGQLSIILALLIVGFIAAIVLLLLLGLVVVWVPLIVAAIAAGVLSTRIRAFWRRLRRG